MKVKIKPGRNLYGKEIKLFGIMLPCLDLHHGGVTQIRGGIDLLRL